MSLKHFALAAALLVTAGCQPASPPFQEALDVHFNSILNRDIDAYKTTLTKSDTLPMIFPDGSYMATRAEVEEFHTRWFADENWRMNFEEVTRIVGKDMASVLVRTAYQDAPDSAPRFAYLNLLFQLQDGEWRLIHDQNTRIILPVQVTPSPTEPKE